MSFINQIKMVQKLSQFGDIIENVKDMKDSKSALIKIFDYLNSLFNPRISCVYEYLYKENKFKILFNSRTSFWDDKENIKNFMYRPSNEWAIGKCFSEKSSILIKSPISASKEKKYYPFSDEIRTEILIPILINNNVQYIIILSLDYRLIFGNKLKEYSHTITQTLSLIFQLVRENELNKNKLDYFSKVTSFNVTTIENYLVELYNYFQSIIPIKIITLYIYNSYDNTLVLRNYHPRAMDNKKISSKDFDFLVLKCSESLSGLAIKEKSPLVFTDIQQNNEFQNKRLINTFKLDWFISVPIIAPNRECFGVINIFPECLNSQFDNSLLELFQISTSFLAVMVKLNNVLETEKFLFTYDKIFQYLVENEESKEIWNNLCELIIKQMHCEACSIFMKNKKGNISLVGTTGIEGNPSYDIVEYLPSEGLTGTAFIQNEPIIYYSDVQNDVHKIHKRKYREKLHSAGYSKSLIFIQIVDHNKNNIGVIRCNNKYNDENFLSSRFTGIDIYKFNLLAQFISNILIKTNWIKNSIKHIERSFNCLHHELLSPIDGILIHIEWLKNRFNKIDNIISKSVTMNNVDLHELLKGEIINKKVEDMFQSGKLIDVLVSTMGKLEDEVQLNLEKISIVNLLYTCRSFMTNELKRKKMDITIEHLGFPKTLADPNQLMRVFYNVLRNSIKYIDEKEKQNYITIKGKQDHNYLYLIVEDNGIGLDPNDISKAFIQLYRGSNARKVFPQGSGLGLAFCKKIIESHGGEIKFTKINKPTILEITLPK